MGFFAIIKEEIAERFFERELEEAYRLGIREGSTRALGSVRVRIETRAQRLTPARQVGAELALEAIDEAKEQWTYA